MGVAERTGVLDRRGMPELVMSGVVIPEGFRSGKSIMWSSSNTPVDVITESGQTILFN